MLENGSSYIFWCLRYWGFIVVQLYLKKFRNSSQFLNDSGIIITKNNRLKVHSPQLRDAYFVQLGQIENGANERAICWKYQHCFFVYTIIDPNLKNLSNSIIPHSPPTTPFSFQSKPYFQNPIAFSPQLHKFFLSFRVCFAKLSKKMQSIFRTCSSGYPFLTLTKSISKMPYSPYLYPLWNLVTYRIELFFQYSLLTSVFDKHAYNLLVSV